MGVRRALALGQHVLHAYRLQDGTHGTAGDDTRTGSGRTDHHERTVIAELLLVRNRTVNNRDLDEVFLGILHAFGDGGLHLRGLAQAVTYDAVLVAHDHDGREAERTTTLGHLRDTLDADETVLEFQIARANFLYVGICHDRLEFKTGFASSFGQLFYSSVIEVSVTVESNGRDSLGGGTLGGQFAHQRRDFTLGFSGSGPGNLLVERRCRGERYAGLVVDKLHIDLLVAAEYRHTGLFGRSADDLADTHLDPRSSFYLVQ